MKIYSYLAILIFSLLSIIPPINFIIQNPPLEYWLWMVLIAGFFGVLTIFLKTNLTLKLIAVGSFITCFFSAVPYLSFTAYVNIIACCYFYILCTKIKDWDIISKALQSVLLLNIIMLFMQFIGHDPLLNFGVFQMEHYGILGQHMQMSSFIVILSSILIMFNKWFIITPFIVSILCHSSWSFICAGLGVVVYAFHIDIQKSAIVFVLICTVFLGWAIKDHKILENVDSKTGRMAIWQRSIELSNQRPLQGWGLGTYKDLFPPLSRLTCTPWRTAHNFIIQLVFEVGYPLTGCLLFGLGCLLWALFKAELWFPLSGLVMILSDGLAHFPDRCIQMVPLMILFLAYCNFSLIRYGGGKYEK